jgi:hypothetical protein
MEWFAQTPEEQFLLHVVTQYSAGRLLSGTLPYRVYSFSYGVVRLRRMTFHSFTLFMSV